MVNVILFTASLEMQLTSRQPSTSTFRLALSAQQYVCSRDGPAGNQQNDCLFGNRSSGSTPSASSSSLPFVSCYSSLFSGVVLSTRGVLRLSSDCFVALSLPSACSSLGKIIGDEAMLPASIVRQRIVHWSCITSFFQFGGIQLITYYLPVWFQVIKGASPSMSGVYTLGNVGAQILFSVISGALGMFLHVHLQPPIRHQRSIETGILPSVFHRRQHALSNWHWTP